MADPVADEWVTVPDDEWVEEPLDPKAARKDAAMRQTFGQNYDRTPAPVGEVLTEQMPKQILMGAALQGGFGLMSKVPVGRLVTQARQGVSSALGKLSPDVVGIVSPRAGNALRMAQTVAGKLQGAQPPAGPVAPPAAPQAVGGAKPKLSASQVKQMMREQYGSEKGGRMLFGPAREGVTAAARKELMQAGTTGGSLPKAAQRAINQELAASSADEAFAYAAKAPNAQAKSYIGEMLQKALEARGAMHGR